MIKTTARTFFIPMYPNQKCVVTKKTISNANSIYGIFNAEATLAAAQHLSDRAFKLYVRMNLHQDGYTYALSAVEVFNATGMSDKRYRDAVKELIRKGYLVQCGDSKNLYTFYEYPEEDAPAEAADACQESAETSRPIVFVAPPAAEDATAACGVSAEESLPTAFAAPPVAEEATASSCADAEIPQPSFRDAPPTAEEATAASCANAEILRPSIFDAPAVSEGEIVQDNRKDIIYDITSDITSNSKKNNTEDFSRYMDYADRYFPKASYWEKLKIANQMRFEGVDAVLKEEERRKREAERLPYYDPDDAYLFEPWESPESDPLNCGETGVPGETIVDGVIYVDEELYERLMAAERACHPVDEEDTDHLPF